MYPPSINRLIVRHISSLLLIAALWFCWSLTGIGCPIYSIFGIRCPTCGATRALLGLFSGRWDLYLHLSPFALPLLVAILIGIHLSVLPGKWKRIGLLYVSITAASNLCWYAGTFL